MRPETTHFDALHGLRGIAAVLVMLGHFSELTAQHLDLAPSGFLAVDLFFLLSGFVIAHAYDEKFRTGMSFWQFAEARIIRLYPLYFAAIGVFMVGVGVVVATQGLSSYSRLDLLASLGFSLLFLPTPPSLSVGPDVLFPLNGPAWSLFYELVANAVFAALALKLARRSLAAIFSLGLLALALMAWAEAPIGTARSRLPPGSPFPSSSAFICGDMRPGKAGTAIATYRFSWRFARAS